MLFREYILLTSIHTIDCIDLKVLKYRYWMILIVQLVLLEWFRVIEIDLSLLDSSILRNQYLSILIRWHQMTGIDFMVSIELQLWSVISNKYSINQYWLIYIG